MRRTIVIVLFSALLLAFPAAAVNNVVPLAGDVYIGEEGLDISACVASNQTIAWFASGTNPNTDTPNYEFNVGNASSFYVAPCIFVGRTGYWFSSWGNGTSTVAFVAVDPSLVIKVWDNDANRDVTGKWIVCGDYLNFRIETNTYSVASRPGYDPSTDGFVTIRVESPDGTSYSALFQNQSVSLPLARQTVSTSLWYWVAVQAGSGWNTGLTDGNGSPLYRGTYIVQAELDLNDIRNNYKAPDGTDYTGKTVSALLTITIREDTIQIESNKDTVVRGNQFSVTVTGRPNEYFYLWVTGTGGMNDPASQPPRIAMNQDSVYIDPPCGTGDPRQATPNSNIGTYMFQGGAGKAIGEDVPSVDSCRYYALLRTSSSGTRTVGFLTGLDTKDQEYTIRAERIFDGKCISDVVDMRVERGVITMVVEGNNQYFLGDSVRFSGIDTEFWTVNLFITGPGLPVDGGLLGDPDTPVCIACDPPVITTSAVLDDCTWSYTWETANLDLDPGNYTVYATTLPADKAHLNGTGYATEVITIRNGSRCIPGPVSNLHPQYVSDTSIRWEWSNPLDACFDAVMVYLNGLFMTNISDEVNWYTAGGLDPDTEYTLSTRTISTDGSISGIWVNQTSRTEPGFDYVPTPTPTPTHTPPQTPVPTVVPTTPVPGSGTVWIYSSPSNAAIFLDGIAKGFTNREVSGVVAGIHNLTLVKSGYQEKTTTIKILPGEFKVLPPITLTKSVGPSAGSGTIYVASSPTGATILIDGTDYGRTNGFVRNVPSGIRNLTLTKTGYLPKTIPVLVEPGGLKVLPLIYLDRA